MQITFWFFDYIYVKIINANSVFWKIFWRKEGKKKKTSGLDSIFKTSHKLLIFLILSDWYAFKKNQQQKVKD